MKPNRLTWLARHGMTVAVFGLLLMPLLALAPLVSPAGVGKHIAWDEVVATLLVSAAAAALATLLGAVAAIALMRTDLPGSAAWLTLLSVPFLVPPTAWTLAQVHCFGPGGLIEVWFGDSLRPFFTRLDQGHFLSTTLVLTQVHLPLAMLLVGRGVSRLHLAGWESALLQLSRRRLALWLLANLRRELAGSWLLLLALGLGNFAVPHVLQCKLYAITVYMQMSNYLDPAGAVNAALPLVVIAVVAAGGLALCERRSVPLATTPAGRAVVRLGSWRWPILLLLSGWLLVTTVLPIVGLLRQCGSPQNFLTAVRDASPETLNTFQVGLGATLVAAAAGLVVGSQLTRGRGRIARNMLILVPLGIPTLIVALAYARFYNRSSPVDLAWIGDSSLLVMLGLGFRAWPFFARIVAAAQARVPDAWGEAAELAGMTPIKRWRWIGLPWLTDALMTGCLVAFVLSIGDVEISQMLCAPGSGTLSLRLFTFLHFGPTHVAASLALLQLTISMTLVFIYSLLANRHLRIV